MSNKTTNKIQTRSAGNTMGTPVRQKNIKTESAGNTKGIPVKPNKPMKKLNND